MLELRGAAKTFGPSSGLLPTSLTFPPASTTVLIGESGCGKSTLLRLLIGLHRPDCGSVHVGGVALTPENVRALRLRMGYVIQDGGLFPHMTALRNIILIAHHLGWDERRMRARVAELCQLTRFPEEHLGRSPRELSGGQRQRVALMRALMLDPEVLLLDEPMGALDPLIRSELQEDLRGIFRALRKTVVLVTHDMGEAAFFADTIVLLHAGRIVQMGSLRDLIDRPADPFVTRFIRAQRGAAELLKE